MRIRASPRETGLCTIIGCSKQMDYSGFVRAEAVGFGHWVLVEGLLGLDLMVKDSTVLVDTEGIPVLAAAQVSAHCSIVAEWPFVSDQFEKSIPYE